MNNFLSTDLNMCLCALKNRLIEPVLSSTTTCFVLIIRKLIFDYSYLESGLFLGSFGIFKLCRNIVEEDTALTFRFGKGSYTSSTRSFHLFICLDRPFYYPM